MASSAASPHLKTYVESDRASDAYPQCGDGIGLGASLVMLAPFALGAWLAIGVTVYLAMT
jgi:hypothetical protein